jgi:hypothetical protein
VKSCSAVARRRSRSRSPTASPSSAAPLPNLYRCLVVTAFRVQQISFIVLFWLWRARQSLHLLRCKSGCLAHLSRWVSFLPHNPDPDAAEDFPAELHQSMNSFWAGEGKEVLFCTVLAASSVLYRYCEPQLRLVYSCLIYQAQILRCRKPSRLRATRGPTIQKVKLDSLGDSTQPRCR